MLRANFTLIAAHIIEKLGIAPIPVPHPVQYCPHWADECGVEEGMARNVGQELARPLRCAQSAWPKAAFGEKGKRHAAGVSIWPVITEMIRIDSFLEFPCRPLSRDLHYPSRFGRDLRKHIDRPE